MLQEYLVPAFYSKKYNFLVLRWVLTFIDIGNEMNFNPCIHCMLNVIEQILHDGSKELAQTDTDSSKYVLSSENKVWVHSLTVYHIAFVWFALLV